MVTDRSFVVDVLRTAGEHDRALQARCALPPQVDTEKDAGLLSQLGVPASMLAGAPAR
jgi:hypothetical protein